MTLRADEREILSAWPVRYIDSGDRIFTLVVPSSPQAYDFTGYEQTNYTPLLEKGETT